MGTVQESGYGGAADGIVPQFDGLKDVGGEEVAEVGGYATPVDEIGVV